MQRATIQRVGYSNHVRQHDFADDVTVELILCALKIYVRIKHRPLASASVSENPTVSYSVGTWHRVEIVCKQASQRIRDKSKIILAAHTATQTLGASRCAKAAYAQGASVRYHAHTHLRAIRQTKQADCSTYVRRHESANAVIVRVILCALDCQSISARGKRFLATSSLSENPTILFSVAGAGPAAEFNSAEIMDYIVMHGCAMTARVAVACVAAAKSSKVRSCKHGSAGADLGGSMCSERCEVNGGAKSR